MNNNFIANRAENNLTAKVFVYLFSGMHSPEKALSLCGVKNKDCRDIRMELFWKGFRDYAAVYKDTREKFMREYLKVIPRARNAVGATRLHIRENFYSAGDSNKIFNELKNTEIDAALFTGSKIFIGEIKKREKPGFNGRNILAHQVVRQRIMVEVLKLLAGDKRKVFSFIICDRDKVNSIKRSEQVKALKNWDGAGPRVVSWQDFMETVQLLPGGEMLAREVNSILEA